MCDVLPAFSFVVVFLLGGTVRFGVRVRDVWIGSRALVYLKSFSPIKILGLIFEHSVLFRVFCLFHVACSHVQCASLNCMRRVCLSCYKV